MTKPQLLIIDDDAWLADSWATTAKAKGFSVRTVRNGQAGIDACDMLRPDVIVLDIVLPGPNGMAFLHELRSHYEFKDVSVIIVTGLSSHDMINQQQYGVQAVFDKQTLTPQQLMHEVIKVKHETNAR